MVGLVFSDREGWSEVSTKRLEQIDKGNHKLVVGGRLSEALCGSSRFTNGLEEAVPSRTAKIFPKQKVDGVERQLIREENHKSDDPHDLALARVTGARLLYTHDVDLTDDIKNRDLIAGQRGKVYQTKEPGEFTRSLHRLLDTGYCST